MTCAVIGCNQPEIKSTNDQKHRYCVMHRDQKYQAALAAVQGLKQQVVAMRNTAYGQGKSWEHINAGSNRGFQEILGGTDNPLRVEREVWYRFRKGNQANVSLSGVLSKHYQCQYGGDTIIIHIAQM